MINSCIFDNIKDFNQIIVIFPQYNVFVYFNND